MRGIIDADTHISEGEAMWAMMDKAIYPRRPLMLSVPEDTVFGNRNAFWLIDGEIYPKAGGKGFLARGRYNVRISDERRARPSFALNGLFDPLCHDCYRCRVSVDQGLDG